MTFSDTTFAKAATNYVNEAPARTANGMKARKSTTNAVLDFFSKAGASRGKPLVAEFTKAVTSDKNLAMRALLWTRDIRTGAGERDQFRQLLTELDKQDPALAGAIMQKIPELGRWDDLFAYKSPRNREAAFYMIMNALNEGNGLCAKWMPRKGPVAAELTKFLECTPRHYRKSIVSLTNVVESKMCAKEWDDINFSHVPSMASSRYQKAFGRHATESYVGYLEELKKPQAERAKGVKINAKAIYPYEIVRNLSTGNSAAADAQWEALPNFIGDASVFPIVDTSGSMGSLRYGSRGDVQPIEVSISLGLYCASKNRSAFKDMFMIFDSTPKLVTASGSLTQRVAQMKSIVSGSTDLHKAFDMLLDIAVKGNVAPDDMPQTLLILSDMQFNCCRGYDDSAQEMIKRKYEKAGYTAPKVVYWNLSRYGNENVAVRFDESGTALVSGFSPSIMTSVLADDLEDYTPYNVMVKTLSNERYDY